MQTLDPSVSNITQYFLDLNYSAQLIEQELGRSYLENYLNFTYTAAEIFVACRLTLRDFPVNCSNYVTEFIGETGRCFTFHSAEYIRENGAINKSHDGISDAVLLLFDTHPDDYFSTKTSAEGVWAQIHDPDDVAYMEKRSVALAPGESTFMAIKKVVKLKKRSIMCRCTILLLIMVLSYILTSGRVETSPRALHERL